MEEEYEVRTLDELYGHLERLREEKGVRWLDIGKALNMTPSSARGIVRTKRNSHFCTVSIMFEVLEYGLYVNNIHIGRCIDLGDFISGNLKNISADKIFRRRKFYDFLGEAVFSKNVKINTGDALDLINGLGYAMKIKTYEQD